MFPTDSIGLILILILIFIMYFSKLVAMKTFLIHLIDAVYKALQYEYLT